MEPWGWIEEYGGTTRINDFQLCFLRPYQGNYLYINDDLMHTFLDIVYISLSGNS
jgi:hypothetical protein